MEISLLLFYFREGLHIATTWLKPIHIGRMRTVAAAFQVTTDYGKNPDKTNEGQFVTGHLCDPETVVSEWLLAKRQYFTITGKQQKREQDVLSYHTEQSFVKGEVSAEEANQIGQELAKALTKGNHAFIVCTHVDTEHYHNHIYISAVAQDYTRKFRNFKNSAWALRRISDKICLEHGLSIVENPKPSRGLKEKWINERGPSYHEKLRWAVDDVLCERPKDFDDFLQRIEKQGYRIKKRGKQHTFFFPGQKNGTRLNTLKGDYTERAIQERIEGTRVVVPWPRSRKPKEDSRINLLIDIPKIIREGKGAGYERWAKIHNLQQMSRSLLFLQDHGALYYDQLETKAAEAKAAFYDATQNVKRLEAKMKDNGDLQKHIVTYSKTRDVYTAYRKAGYSKKFRAAHESDILLHQTAKKAFDDLETKKIPTVAALRKEYADLLAQKKKAEATRATARSDMQEMLKAKSNIDVMLGNDDGGKTSEVLQSR